MSDWNRRLVWFEFDLNGSLTSIQARGRRLRSWGICQFPLLSINGSIAWFGPCIIWPTVQKMIQLTYLSAEVFKNMGLLLASSSKLMPGNFKQADARFLPWSVCVKQDLQFGNTFVKAWEIEMPSFVIIFESYFQSL